MPPRPRNPENRDLPRRWQFTHGAYYYRVPPGLESRWGGFKRFPLGKTLREAYARWSERVDAPDQIRAVDDLFDRYELEVVPTKAPKTQKGNRSAIRRLRLVFGRMGLGDIKPRHIYQYADKRGAQVAAHREIEVLSHAFTKAVEWGLIDRHPFRREVRLERGPARDRYVEDWEIAEILALPPTRKAGSVRAIQAYIVLKLMTGMGQGDLLRLQPAVHFRSDGIHIQRHKTMRKTQKRTIYTWTDDLRAVVDVALAARPVDISPFLFCNKHGQGYVNEETGEAEGWSSMWQRFMRRVLEETKVARRFTEHDLRAKVGSDADTLEHARQLLSHADHKTTLSVYRRKPEVVRPLPWTKKG